MLLSYFFTVDFTVGDCKMFIQGYTVFKFYPLSFKYRDPAASPLNARQCMLENQAIKLINRQFTFTRFQDYTLHGYTVFKFYPLSFKYRDSVPVL